MSVQVFDANLSLVSGQALAVTGQATGVLLYPRLMEAVDWCCNVSGIVATGTYTFQLAVSDLIGGTYTPIHQVVWPPAVPGGRIHMPIQGQLAAFLDSDCRYMRVGWVIGGTTPGGTLTSFLAKSANNAGLGVRVGDIVSVG